MPAIEEIIILRHIPGGAVIPRHKGRQQWGLPGNRELHSWEDAKRVEGQALDVAAEIKSLSITLV